MICKGCGKAIPWAERHDADLVRVDGIGVFHRDCITAESERLLEQKIDDVKRWAIEVGIIHVRGDHDPEYACEEAP